MTDDEIKVRTIIEFNKRRSAALKQKNKNLNKSESPTKTNDESSKMNLNDNQTGCKSAVSGTGGSSVSQETVDFDFQNMSPNGNIMESNSTYGLDSLVSTRSELDDLADSSDSEDIVCNISLKKNEDAYYIDE